jgi:hypothetical protein
MKSIFTFFLVMISLNLFAQQNFTVEWESDWVDYIGIGSWETTNSVMELIVFDKTAHLYKIYDGATKVLKYTYSNPDTSEIYTFWSYNYSVPIDVNSDGVHDFVFLKYTNGNPNPAYNLRIISGATGQLLYQNSYNYSVYPITLDIDGDGWIELILSLHDNSTSKAKFVILSTTSHSVGINNSSNTITNFNLGQNYPNPFNPTTTIEYSIEKDANVQMEIYNDLGQLMKTYQEGNKKSGSYKLLLDGTSLSSGAYFYRLVVNGLPETKKMIMIK